MSSRFATLNEHEQTVGHAPNFHRPLSTYVNETIRLGCSIVEIAEPQLRAEQVELPPQEILTRIPNYILIAARHRAVGECRTIRTRWS